MIRICQRKECSKEFNAKHSETKYCSKACRNITMRIWRADHYFGIDLLK